MTERFDKTIRGVRKKHAAYVYYYRDIKVKLQRLGNTRATYCSFNFPRESFALMPIISSLRENNSIAANPLRIYVNRFPFIVLHK